ncbi:hypothetical protein LEP1GSC108_3647 [Leptospira weilii str. UI 13098]|uniref:Uncharacterized protein n=1 Tax=Leptospira weilii str. UI 13098 TaxID=1088542 RepID=M6QJJ6_9LEPT|nr:hypothetical protein LEP1GSC086_1489 [Leptospira weilii str. LNT 1234]EMN89042.1 hypothetical protein LEP1GSC108_3647 [Leptospira weilii str. UI 13098]
MKTAALLQIDRLFLSIIFMRPNNVRRNKNILNNLRIY